MSNTTPPPVHLDIERHGGRLMVGRIDPFIDMKKPGDFLEVTELLADGTLGHTHYLNPRGISAATVVSEARAKQLAAARGTSES